MKNNPSIKILDGEGKMMVSDKKTRKQKSGLFLLFLKCCLVLLFFILANCGKKTVGSDGLPSNVSFFRYRINFFNCTPDTFNYWSLGYFCTEKDFLAVDKLDDLFDPFWRSDTLRDGLEIIHTFLDANRFGIDSGHTRGDAIRRTNTVDFATWVDDTGGIDFDAAFDYVDLTAIHGHTESSSDNYWNIKFGVLYQFLPDGKDSIFGSVEFRPDNKAIINANSCNNFGLSTSDIRRQVFAHEYGHCIGFRHCTNTLCIMQAPFSLDGLIIGDEHLFEIKDPVPF